MIPASRAGMTVTCYLFTGLPRFAPSGVRYELKFFVTTGCRFLLLRAIFLPPLRVVFFLSLRAEGEVI